MSDKSSTEDLIEQVRSRGYFVTQNPNRYDRADMVARDSVLLAAGLKLASYRARDPETLEWGPLQFHMTYDNTVLAVMSEQAARLFCQFVGGAFERAAVNLAAKESGETP